MNKHYNLLAEIQLPPHKAELSIEDSLTTLYVYDVDDETADELNDIFDEGMKDGTGKYAVSLAIRKHLDAWDDDWPLPGTLFHRYTVDFDLDHTVLVWRTTTYNV